MFSKIFSKIGKILLSIFYCVMLLVTLSFEVLVLYCTLYLPIWPLLIFFTPVAMFFPLMYAVLIERMLRVELYNTGLVVNGHSVFDFERTKRYFKTQAIFSFLNALIYFVMSILFVGSISTKQYIFNSRQFNDIKADLIVGVVLLMIYAVISIFWGIRNIEQQKYIGKS